MRSGRVCAGAARPMAAAAKPTAAITAPNDGGPRGRVGGDVEIDGDAEDPREPPRQEPISSFHAESAVSRPMAATMAAGIASPSPTAASTMPVARRRPTWAASAQPAATNTQTKRANAIAM